ncbi:hypothetical protein [Acinetobacter pragensis]|uniref:Uncharacterized protein n=1 Tax=Acinetobacter pragensis TaxID=1806892 RepID=A0A151Y4R6_9GAMM|nr:hypothetical protein AZH43_01495 [Acinetobacter pragensis]
MFAKIPLKPPSGGFAFPAQKTALSSTGQCNASSSQYIAKLSDFQPDTATSPVDKVIPLFILILFCSSTRQHQPPASACMTFL